MRAGLLFCVLHSWRTFTALTHTSAALLPGAASYDCQTKQSYALCAKEYQ